jgi:hypothetical protein
MISYVAASLEAQRLAAGQAGRRVVVMDISVHSPDLGGWQSRQGHL